MTRTLIRTRSSRAALASVLSLLLLISLLGAPGQALAASEPSDMVKASVADTFEPGRLNRTPVGDPIRPGAGGEPKSLDSSGFDRESEVVGRRTANSRTSVSEQGLMVTEFFQDRIHYQDSKGVWQIIDNRLVASDEPGMAARTAANDVVASLPTSLASGPARVASGEHFVEFRLDGGTGAVSQPPPAAEIDEPTPEPLPQPDGATSSEQDTSPGDAVPDQPQPSPSPSPQPVEPGLDASDDEDSDPEPSPDDSEASGDSVQPKLLESASGAVDLLPISPNDTPSTVPAEIDDDRATYPQVFDGVDALYTSMTNGLKEELILESADVPSSYDYTVKMSQGLTASSTPTGIEFVDETGQVWGRFSAPFAADAAASLQVPLQGVTFDDVKLEIVSQDADQLHVRLSIAEDWLRDPSREFPVVIDPSLLTGASGFTFITSVFPDSNFDDYPDMAIYGDPYPYRILAKPLIDLTNFFREPVQITKATISLIADTDTTGAVAKPVGVYEVTNPWTSSQVTWNKRKTGTSWSKAGGDVVASPETVKADITGPNGWRTWSVLSMVNAWKDGQRPYNGMMIKYVDDSVAAPSINFGHHGPLFTLNWVPQQGLHDPYAFESFSLGEGSQALVSLANGSLKLIDTDVAIAGTGMGTVLQRGYESRALRSMSLGLNWMLWPQGHSRLYGSENGDLYWVGGPEQFLTFRKNLDGSYRSPQGYRATLEKLPNNTYVINMHDSGTKQYFADTGYPTSTEDRNGNQVVYAYTYNAGLDEYLMTSLTDTRGRVTTFTHNSAGKVTKVTDPAGRQSLYGYTDGRLSSYTDTAGKVTSYQYLVTDPPLASPPLSRITDPNGNQTRFEYANSDALYNPGFPTGTTLVDSTWRLTKLTKVTNPATGAGHSWGFEYTPGQTKVTDPNQHLTTYTMDSLGRVTQTKDHLNKTTQTAYNAQGFVTSITDQDSKTTQITRDALHNVTAVKLPSQMQNQTSYTDAAHPYYPTQGENSQGHSINLGYDSPGNLNMRQNQLPANNQLDIEHNPNGTVSKTTDGMGNETNYVYFANGDLKQINRPLGVGNQSFTYDNLSRVSTVTDAKGQVTEFTYDGMDRVTRVDYADDSAVVNVYDDGGRLVRREDVTGTGLLDPTHVTTFGYDALNRQTSKNVGGLTYTSTFDGVGNLKTLTDPAGTVSYDYNAVDLLTKLTEPSGAVTTFGYDGAYRRNLISYPNGVTQTTVYDSDGMVSSIVGKKADGTTLTSFGYNYHDAGGNKTELVQTLTEPAGQTSYTYDVVDRLTKAQGPHGTFEYSFDGNWNLTSKTVGGQTIGYAYNGADQITVSGATTYAYDQNGNLTATSDGPTLAYNAKDQMTGYSAPGPLGTTTPMEYLDTGQFERIQAGGTTFSTGPLGLASSTDAAVLSTNYVRDSNGGLVARKDLLGTQYYLFDRLGSVVALTDASGNAVNTYVYDPYGNHLAGTTEAVANPWQFAGGFKDSFSGYYKFGTRYYDPEIGRWTQPDPSGMEANSYAYAAGNPVNFVDPTGLLSWGGAWDWVKEKAKKHRWQLASVAVGAWCVATVTSAGVACYFATSALAAAKVNSSYKKHGELNSEFLKDAAWDIGSSYMLAVPGISGSGAMGTFSPAAQRGFAAAMEGPGVTCGVVKGCGSPGAPSR